MNANIVSIIFWMLNHHQLYKVIICNYFGCFPSPQKICYCRFDIGKNWMVHTYLCSYITWASFRVPSANCKNIHPEMPFNTETLNSNNHIHHKIPIFVMSLLFLDFFFVSQNKNCMMTQCMLLLTKSVGVWLEWLGAGPVANYWFWPNG